MRLANPLGKPAAAARPPRLPRPGTPRRRGRARASRLKGVRPLIVEARRAELDVGGLFVDFGTADQLKYTAGGWGNGWGERKVEADGATTYAEARGRLLPVRMFLYKEPGQARQVALRVRTRGPPRPIAIQIDGRPVGRARVGPAWSTMSVPLAPESVGPGPPRGRHLRRGPRPRWDSTSTGCGWVARATGSSPRRARGWRR